MPHLSMNDNVLRPCAGVQYILHGEIGLYRTYPHLGILFGSLGVLLRLRQFASSVFCELAHSLT